MASRILYPPIIASSLPAFVVSDSTLRVPISFSKFNNPEDFKNAQVTIVKKDTGMSVVNTADDIPNNRFRATGIILNVPVQQSVINGKLETYIEIKESDLKSKVLDNTQNNSQVPQTSQWHQGWVPGWYYKIQIRLSSETYEEGDIGQQSWLTLNASKFSEWSTVCILKAIGDITINVTSFGCTYETNSSETVSGSGSSMTFVGNYSCGDTTEFLNNYRVKIFNYPRSAGDAPLDDSGYIYNTNTSTNEFNYSFRINPEAGTTQYVVELEYNTINGFNEIIDINYSLVFRRLTPLNVNMIILENDDLGILKGISSLGEEEDEGRVAIKLYNGSDEPFTGNIAIRRASSRTKFEIWEDIKIFQIKNQIIDSLPVWYDYTIESGVWYKYGIQAINNENERSRLVTLNPIIRNFSFSYLLGENNQQLKLMFNNEMGNFSRQIMDSHIDTIGGKYPVFSRNASTDYKIFPVNGLITFYMDEKNTFTNKKIIYNGNEIAELYKNYNEENDITQYDYIYEREFRNLVSDFLYDGKPKLFKSPTEGNILVRISDVSMSPHQELNRIIYNFDSQAYEIADSTIDNYKKYNLLDLPEISSL